MADGAIRLSETEERELRRRAGQYTRPYREVIRAKIVLLAAEGLGDQEIAERLDCTRPDGGQVATKVRRGGHRGVG
jgi:DNA-binding CsgD family transcriptional regulator